MIISKKANFLHQFRPTQMGVQLMLHIGGDKKEWVETHSLNPITMKTG